MHTSTVFDRIDSPKSPARVANKDGRQHDEHIDRTMLLTQTSQGDDELKSGCSEAWLTSVSWCDTHDDEFDNNLVAAD